MEPSQLMPSPRPNFREQHQTAQAHSAAIEAILHASETPVTAKQLGNWLGLTQHDIDTA